jgi:hypothetical protein
VGIPTVLAAAAILAVAAAGSAAALVSQGAARMGADALWSRGVLGSGQTVAVLDLGFGGLDEAIAAGEMPPRERLTLMSFDAANGINGRSALEDPTQHGVRMAEIVYDVAPEATLVLVNYHTEEEFGRAVAWVVGQGIPVVSHSNSFLTPPFDGTGPTARVVDSAAAAGVLWINSAGNFAERHWGGRAAGTGVAIPLAPRPGDRLAFTLGWRAPDVAAELGVERQAPDGAWTRVATGQPIDRGAGTPVVPVDGGTWRVVVRQTAGAPADLDLFSRTVGFGSMSVAAGSVPTPGDAAGALSVGAVPWTGTSVAAYSSQGPTDGGGAKPDLAAPTYVTANAAWPGTAGTSAATAHVAGAAALLRQARQSAGLPAGAADLRAALLADALDLGAPGPDPVFGAGLVRLDAIGPRLQVRVGPGLRPKVTVRASDEGSVQRVEAQLGDRPMGTRRGPVGRFRVPPVRAGRYRLSVTARDLAGNATTVSRWITLPAR